MKVALFFEGVVEVEIDADPNDDEAWTDAIAEAVAGIPADELSRNSECVGHECLEPEGNEGNVGG